jgi:hypothetical protein
MGWRALISSFVLEGRYYFHARVEAMGITPSLSPHTVHVPIIRIAPHHALHIDHSHVCVCVMCVLDLIYYDYINKIIIL